MATPEVSIVLTSYNHREYLRQALDSLLNQTFRDFELIIVDDCSTDGSQKILKEYAEKDDRIRLELNTQNTGSYVYSTNQGAALANAPYVIFAQCDDWAEPTQLEELHRIITHEEVGVVFSKSNLVDEKGLVIGSDLDSRDRHFINKYGNGGTIVSDEAFQELVKACIIPNLSAAMVRTSVFRELNGLSSDYRVLADWDFWMRLSCSRSIYYLPKPLNNFRQHGQTIRSQVKIARQMDELVKMYRKALTYRPEMKSFILQNAAVNWILFAYGNHKAWLKSFSACWKKGKELSANWWLYFIRGSMVVLTRYIAHIIR